MASKDSLDRFGDDFCGLVLSYLSFDDSLRHEIVSKQWQRLVYCRRTELIIDCDQKDNDFYKFVVKYDSYDRLEPLLSLRRLKTIVKKCPNIGSIRFNGFQCYSDIFELIVKYCHNLRHIEWDFNWMSKNRIKLFTKKFGSQLKTIRLFDNTYDYRPFLSLCPNVSHLDIQCFKGLSVIFTEDQIVMKKLKEIRCICRTSTEDINRFETLIDSNRNSLQSIDVFFGYDFHYFESSNGDKDLNVRQLKTVLKSLTKLSKLTKLSLHFNSFHNSLIDCLVKIGTKCEQLVKLELSWSSDDEHLFERIYHSLNGFKQLKRLTLSTKHMISVKTDFRSESLKSCPKLTHLEFVCQEIYINEEFFEDIDKHLPQLQVIQIGVNLLTDKTLDSLFKLKHIQELKISTKDIKIESIETTVEKVIQNWPKIRRIYFKFKSIFNEIMTTIDMSLNQINKFKERDGKAIDVDIYGKDFCVYVWDSDVEDMDSGSEESFDSLKVMTAISDDNLDSD